MAVEKFEREDSILYTSDRCPDRVCCSKVSESISGVIAQFKCWQALGVKQIHNQQIESRLKHHRHAESRDMNASVLFLHAIATTFPIPSLAISVWEIDANESRLSYKSDCFGLNSTGGTWVILLNRA